MPPPSPSALTALRTRIRALETGVRASGAVLPFGITVLDAALPGGGLALGALHEVAGGGAGVLDAAAAALFAAGVLARRTGPVLWCLTRADLFAPALDQAGLVTDRVIHAEAPDQTTLLACFEEGLRHGGLAGVVAEVSRLPMTASRRLRLAAEATGTPGIALRRWTRAADAADFGHPSAAVTRWRITALPSSPSPVPGVGRAVWRVELLRVRGGESADFILEACDAAGHLGVPAVLANRPAAARDGAGRARA